MLALEFHKGAKLHPTTLISTSQPGVVVSPRWQAHCGTHRSKLLKFRESESVSTVALDTTPESHILRTERSGLGPVLDFLHAFFLL